MAEQTTVDTLIAKISEFATLLDAEFGRRTIYNSEHFEGMTFDQAKTNILDSVGDGFIDPDELEYNTNKSHRETEDRVARLMGNKVFDPVDGQNSSLVGYDITSIKAYNGLWVLGSAQGDLITLNDITDTNINIINIGNTSPITSIHYQVNTGTWYIGTDNGTLYTSSNVTNEATWDELVVDTVVWNDTSVVDIFTNADGTFLYFMATDTIISYEIASDTWSEINKPDVTSFTHYAYDWDYDDHYILTDTGIFVSDDNLLTWSFVDVGFVDQVYSFYIGNGGGHTAIDINGNRVWRESKTKRWISVSNNYMLTKFESGWGNIWVAIGNDNRIYRSIDKGRGFRYLEDYPADNDYGVSVAIDLRGTGDITVAGNSGHYLISWEDENDLEALESETLSMGGDSMGSITMG